MGLSRKERVRWAINYVAERDGLSNPKIGKKLGVKGDTINSYRTMATDAKPDFYVRFSETFDVDLVWLLKGTGEPFSDAREQYPDVCGEVINNDRVEFVSDHSGLYGTTRRHKIEGVDHVLSLFEPEKTGVFAQAIGMLDIILKSDDQIYRQAIISNLIAFSHAVRRQQQQSDTISELLATVQDLKRRLEILEQRHSSSQLDEKESQKSAAT